MATTSGVKAGKAFVIIEAIDKTAFIMNRVGRRVKALGQEITNVGMKLMRFSAMGLLPFAFGAKTFMTFDDAMRKVEARSSGTAQEMQALRNQAAELGRTTSFTAAQVGELQAKLSQKGFDRSQIKAMTADVLDLAKAAGEGTEEDATIAADAISGTIRAFQLNAGEATRIADVFATAVNNSNFSLAGLMDSMSKAAPIASSYGMSIEETVAALASMTNLNIEASDAGTAMKTFFLRMSDPTFTDTFNQQLQDAGGNLIKFRDASGNLRSPLEIFKEIGQATRGLGTAKRGELFSSLFGVLQAGKAVGAVSGMADAFKLLNKLQKQSQGVAAKTATQMEAGLGGAWRKFLSAIEGVSNALGEAIAGPLNRFNDAIGPILNSIATWIDENRDLVSTVFLTIAGVGALGAATSAAGFGIMGIGATISGLAAVLATFTAGLTAIVSPLGIVAAAIAGLGYAGFYSSDTLKSTMQEASETVTHYLGDMDSMFRRTFRGMRDAILAGDLASAIQIGMQAVKVAWMQGVNDLLPSWKQFTSTVDSSFVEIATSLGSRLANASSLGMQQSKVTWMSGTDELWRIWSDLIARIVEMFPQISNALMRTFLDVGAAAEKFGNYVKLQLTNDPELTGSEEGFNRRLKELNDAVDQKNESILKLMDIGSEIGKKITFKHKDKETKAREDALKAEQAILDQMIKNAEMARLAKEAADNLNPSNKDSILFDKLGPGAIAMQSAANSGAGVANAVVAWHDKNAMGTLRRDAELRSENWQNNMLNVNQQQLDAIKEVARKVGGWIGNAMNA